MMGQNPQNQCFIVGFDGNCPEKPHHRSSSCPASGDCNNGQNNGGPNPMVSSKILVADFRLHRCWSLMLVTTYVGDNFEALVTKLSWWWLIVYIGEVIKMTEKVTNTMILSIGRMLQPKGLYTTVIYYTIQTFVLQEVDSSSSTPLALEPIVRHSRPWAT